MTCIKLCLKDMLGSLLPNYFPDAKKVKKKVIEWLVHLQIRVFKLTRSHILLPCTMKSFLSIVDIRIFTGSSVHSE